MNNTIKRIWKISLVATNENVKKRVARLIYLGMELLLFIIVATFAFEGKWFEAGVMIPLVILIWLIEKLLNYFWQ